MRCSVLRVCCCILTSVAASTTANGVFINSMLGVATSITLKSATQAHVSVTGLGFARSGIANIRNDMICLDDAFESFLRRRGVILVDIVERGIDRICVRVRLPLIGYTVVRLDRKL